MVLHMLAFAHMALFYTYVALDVMVKTISRRLLCSRFRIVPLKATSPPQLELCASVLLAKLVEMVRLHLTFQIEDHYYYSDSMITLYWM